MYWTRRSFLKYAGLATGLLVMDCPIPSSLSISQGQGICDDETIEAAFLGMGQYGHGLGMRFLQNWPGDYPVNVQPKVQARDQIESLAAQVKGKDLVFLACDQYDMRTYVILQGILSSKPYLVISLHPRTSPVPNLTHPSLGLLSTPPLSKFPLTWDPVTAILSSLVNPGLIGVDLADLEHVLVGKKGKVDVKHLRYPFSVYHFQEWLLSMEPDQGQAAYIIIEHSRDLGLDIEEISNLAGIVNSAVMPEASIFYSAPHSQQPHKNMITIILAS